MSDQRENPETGKARLDDWPPERIKRWLRNGALFGVGAYLAWAGVVYVLSGTAYGSAGSFGDSFAPLTGLLSALTLAAVVLT